PRDDVADPLAAADVLVLPSLWEGQPLALQEMLRAGRPIVATRVGGVPEMLGDGGMLVEPGNAEELASAVAAILADGDLASSLSHAAAVRAASLPTVDDACELVLQDYC